MDEATREAAEQVVASIADVHQGLYSAHRILIRSVMDEVIRQGWTPPGVPSPDAKGQAVIDKARAWRAMRSSTPTTPKPESAALIAAVDALDG